MSVRPQEGTEVYTCYACRELFGSKSSFLDHVNRFTIVLHFKCDVCGDNEGTPFYNPCSLLLHSRGHYSPFGGHINLDNIKVSCLPYGLVGFPPHPNIPMYYNIREEPSNGIIVNTRFYTPVRTNRGKNLITMMPTVLLFYHYKLNGTPPASLVLKQICINVPKCAFVRLENNTMTTNVVTTAGINRKIVMQPEPVISINESTIQNTINEEPNECNTRLDDVDTDNTAEINGIEDISLSTNTSNNNSEKEVITNSSNNTEVETPPITVKEEVDSDVSNESSSEIPADTLNRTNHTSYQSIKSKEFEGSTCPECHVPIPREKVISSHFTSTAPLDDAYLCDICKYIAPTRCSFTAHQRLHDRQPPYICPECGKDFADNMSLLDHLEDVCFHLAKQVRLKCPKKNCCKVFAQLSTFMTHFEVHIQTLNKCTMCDATYYAVRDFVEHGQTVHQQVVPVELIYKCTICKNSALEAENFRQHVNWHCIDNTLRVYVYICKFCRNFFRSGLTYATHLMRCSKKELTIEELRRLRKCNAAVVCLHCNYVVRLVTTLPDCPRCGKNMNITYVTEKDNVSNAQNINTNANNIVATTINSNCNTNVNNSSNNSRTIKCILCYKDLIVCEAHLHDCPYRYPQVILTKEDEKIQRILSIKHEISEPAVKFDANSKKKRRKSTTSPLLIKHKRSADVELRLDQPIPFEGTYVCRVCDYNDSDRTSFHEHIRQHRNVSTSYQCMECGECFVVKPSFHKHLMYFHRISNVDDYVRENECVDESAISELRKYMRLESGEINDDVEENQCKVCLKQFDDSLELNKHFRVHGMAFLRNNK
ncbi:zinc finger protein [Holotrichia oblita]|uniref:Zinc finger protein n=1 Tax=Holotrichia oblita TaxID=644536 RepID=A0ACB9SYX2_HOLOL|nr:zinc finger protein [Holotrichia oblita]